MRLVGNIVWFIFGGGILGLLYLLLGAICSATVILHPIGKSCYNIAKLMFAPFGKEIIQETELKGSENVHGARKAGGNIVNIIWFVLVGVWLCIAHVFASILMFIGIITIPFGFVHLKLARIAVWPIGAKVVSKELVQVVRQKAAEKEYEELRKEQ